MISGQPVRSIPVWYDWNDHIEERSFANELRTALINGTNAYPASMGLLLDARATAGVAPHDNRPEHVHRAKHLRAGNHARSPHSQRETRGNQSGAGIGARPVAIPSPNYDAFVWVKPPGESDGFSSLIRRPGQPRWQRLRPHVRSDINGQLAQRQSDERCAAKWAGAARFQDAGFSHSSCSGCRMPIPAFTAQHRS